VGKQSLPTPLITVYQLLFAILRYMATFLKIFFGFWLLWVLWYVTGGPYRDDKTKPFIGVTKNGGLQTFGTSTTK